MIWYILGLFVAFWLGFFVCALMVIAKEADDTIEHTHNNSVTIRGLTGDGPLTVSKPDVDSLGGEK